MWVRVPGLNVVRLREADERLFSARCPEPALNRTTNAQRSVSMDWCKGVGLARGAMPCAVVEICKQCSSAAEALPQQRRSRGTASFTKVRAPLLATRAEKSAKMHSDCQKREGAGRTAAPDHAMVSSSDRHRETPPTSTKPTTKTTMSCEAMGAAHSIAWSPLAPGAAAGRPPSPWPRPLEEPHGVQRQGRPTQRFLSVAREVARFVSFRGMSNCAFCTFLFCKIRGPHTYRPIGAENVTDPRARSIFCGTEFRATRTARRGKLVT